MKKRNRRTEIMTHRELAPVTAHILETMGQEGAAIRKRLQILYRKRAGQLRGRPGPYLEHSA